jgi:hypothetical protein
MIDLEQRLRRTFSAMAGNEALSDMPDEEAAAHMLKWAEELAKYFVLQTGDMEDAAAEEFLSPYLRALRTLMRAIGRWAVEADQANRLQWWARIEQGAKTLYGEQLTLPAMEDVVAQLPAGASVQQIVAFLKELIENQAPKG